nr:trehalose-phosphatase [Novosphingobium hassiacum]
MDLDGTLFDLVDRPDDVRADAHIHRLLERLLNHLNGRLAVVSGRSLAQIDRMLGATASDLWVSGSHGCERRWQGVIECPPRPSALDDAAAQFHAFAHDRPGVLVEEKSLGVALHYRVTPQAETAALTLARELANQHGLLLQHGKMMAELRVGSADKGSAIRTMMSRPPMPGTIPVFAGDDVTDEPGFEAVRDLGGHGILVGEPRPTAANYGLSSPTNLREWLWGVLP